MDFAARILLVLYIEVHSAVSSGVKTRHSISLNLTSSS